MSSQNLQEVLRGNLYLECTDNWALLSNFFLFQLENRNVVNLVLISPF